MKKNSRIFSTILAVLLLPSVALAQGYTVPGSELARPRSLVDHGRTDRLNGTPGLAETPGCPSGQVLSGGACVLISNQVPVAPAYDRAWTSYFLGQTKCNTSSSMCASILGDGRIRFYQQNSGGAWVYDVPISFNGASHETFSSGCYVGTTTTAQPLFSSSAKLNGYAPFDWALNVTGQLPGNC